MLPRDAPAWAGPALAAVPWVTVRRASAPEGFAAVGVRGCDRSQRYAWTIPLSVVREQVKPEQLTGPVAGRPLPAIRVLSAVRGIVDAFAWGPTGSVGFELATGAHAVSLTSDLDMVMRMSQCDEADLRRLKLIHRRLSSLQVRIDCLVETDDGAIALTELVSDSDAVLLRTSDGPRLVARAAAVP